MDKKLSELSFACPNCGDWLPTQEAYEIYRHQLNMAPYHECLCGKTRVRDLRLSDSADEGRK